MDPLNETEVIIYSLPNCKNCRATKNVFAKNNVNAREISLMDEEFSHKRAEFKEQGHKAAPVVEVIKDGEVVDSWSGYAPDKIAKYV